MNLTSCKKCPFHLSLKADEIMCGYRNEVTYRIIGRDEKSRDFRVMGCPRFAAGGIPGPHLFEDKNPPFWKI